MTTEDCEFGGDQFEMVDKVPNDEVKEETGDLSEEDPRSPTNSITLPSITSHSDYYLAKHRMSIEMQPPLFTSCENKEIVSLAKRILKSLPVSANMNVANKYSIRKNPLYMSAINAHVYMLIEMQKIEPCSVTPYEIVKRAFSTLEMAGVSQISGFYFLSFSREEMISVVYDVACLFGAKHWRDYDDIVYSECHRLLISYVPKYVNTWLLENTAAETGNTRCCCVFM